MLDRIQRRPEYKGKHFTFWHLISEGEIESKRTPDMRRCERLRWIKWVIENVLAAPEITYWESKPKGSTNIVVWYETGGYAVVLAKRSGYYLLKTAYVVKPRRAKGFEYEREQYKKKQANKS